MKPIAIFYHCLFVMGEPPQLLPGAMDIIDEQMGKLIYSGLLEAATEVHVGVNDDERTGRLAAMFLPQKARLTWHGLASRAENPTIVLLENWAQSHPDWNVLYFHSKGATHLPDSYYGEQVSRPWRDAMMQDLVMNWRECVAALDTHDIVCSHWMWNLADGTQHIPCGNFLWVTSNFVARLPSIYERERIKTSGISALESRYESEVYWGNGPRPNVKQFRPNGGGGVP